MTGAPETARSVTSRAFDYDRTVALSDGVFAIALTILVLTISFPDLHGAARGQLGTALEHRISQVFSYALSFAVLGLLWLRHHAFFRELTRIDATVAVLNLIYLALIAFLPYPTRLLGVYGDEAVSVVAYATTILLISLTATLMRLHAVRSSVAPRPPREAWIWQLAAPAVFLISIPVALLIGTTAAKWTWVLLVLAPLALRRALGVKPAAAPQ